MEAPPTVERLSKSASQRSDGDDYDDDAAGGGGGGPWYGHVRVYARAAGTPAAALSVLFSHRWRVLHSTSYEGESHSLVPIHPPHLDGIAATIDKKLGPAATDVDTFCDVDDGASASALLGLRRGVGIGVAASPGPRAPPPSTPCSTAAAPTPPSWARDAWRRRRWSTRNRSRCSPTLRADELLSCGGRARTPASSAPGARSSPATGRPRRRPRQALRAARLPAAAAAAPPPPPPRQAAASSSAAAAAAAVAAAEEEDLPTFSQADPGTVEMLEAAARIRRRRNGAAREGGGGGGGGGRDGRGGRAARARGGGSGGG